LKEAKEKKDSTAGAVKQCETELKRTEQLISGLGKEKGRWTYGASDLNNLHSNVVGDIVLSSRDIAYLGPQRPVCRQILCS